MDRVLDLPVQGYLFVATHCRRCPCQNTDGGIVVTYIISVDGNHPCLSKSFRNNMESDFDKHALKLKDTYPFIILV